MSFVVTTSSKVPSMWSSCNALLCKNKWLLLCNILFFFTSANNSVCSHGDVRLVATGSDREGRWSFVLVESGPLYAAMDGMRGKPVWCAGSWDILEMVCPFQSKHTHGMICVVCVIAYCTRFFLFYKLSSLPSPSSLSFPLLPSLNTSVLPNPSSHPLLNPPPHHF